MALTLKGCRFTSLDAFFRPRCVQAPPIARARAREGFWALASLLRSRLPEPFAEALRKSRVDRRPLFLAEEEIIGASHAEIGAYLLSLWGLPAGMVGPICLHHRPAGDDGAKDGLGIMAAIHIADGLAHALSKNEPGEADPVAYGLNWEYLATVGVTEETTVWRRMAEKAVER
jgi:hypothetical protein